MATDQSTTATTGTRNPWDGEPFKLSQERAATPSKAQQALQQYEEELLRQLKDGQGLIDPDQVLPEDDQGPWLTEDMRDSMIAMDQPFVLLPGGVRYQSEGKHGAKWIIRIDIDGTVLSASLTSKPDTNPYREEKMARLMSAVSFGRPIGPFHFIAIDTGKGRPYIDIEKYRGDKAIASDEAKRVKKNALTDMRGKTGA